MRQRRPRLVLSNALYTKLKRLVIERDKDRCIICHNPFGLDAHHVVFRSALGDDAEDNLVTLCRRCHDFYAHGVHEKHWRSQFLEYLQSNEIRAWRAAHAKRLEAFKKDRGVWDTDREKNHE